MWKSSGRVWTRADSATCIIRSYSISSTNEQDLEFIPKYSTQQMECVCEPPEYSHLINNSYSFRWFSHFAQADYIFRLSTGWRRILPFAYRLYSMCVCVCVCERSARAYVQIQSWWQKCIHCQCGCSYLLSTVQFMPFPVHAGSHTHSLRSALYKRWPFASRSHGLSMNTGSFQKQHSNWMTSNSNLWTKSKLYGWWLQFI